MRPLFLPALGLATPCALCTPCTALQRMKPFFPARHHISLFAGLLTLQLAMGWLLPNHYPPWLAFHSNAWVACALLLIAGRGLLQVRTPVELTTGGVVLLLVAAIPWLQHVAGLLPLASNAALLVLYLLGAAGAYIVGHHWNKAQPAQPIAYVFMALAIAAVASAALATYQWLGLAQDLGLMDIWVLPFGEGTRPYANMGQTNQLASLLLCGLLGIGWAWRAGHIGGALAWGLAAWVLWGVALTESRTALLTLVLGVGFLTLRRPTFLQRGARWAVQALFVFYLVCLGGKVYLAQALGLDMPLSLVVRSAGELRWALWQMSWDASLHSPWVGYGWGNANAGYFVVFEEYRQKFGNTYFAQSHNLVLDLALWIGWPLTIALCGLAAAWLWRGVRAIDSLPKALVFSALMVLLIHAMLEFPLHYGYFLWPFCMLAGAFAALVGIDEPVRWRVKRSIALALVLGALVLEAVIVLDYLRIEEAFTELRFQVARVGTDHDESLPRTWFLTDWPDAIALARKTPREGMTQAEIDHWEALMIYNTSPLAIRKVIGANKLNGHEDLARAWADRTCWLLSEKACAGLYDEWQKAPPPESGKTAASQQ